MDSCVLYYLLLGHGLGMITMFITCYVAVNIALKKWDGE